MATYFKDNHQGYTSKPVGPVEIDWSHPLAQKLLAYWRLDDLRDMMPASHHLTNNGVTKTPLGYYFDGVTEALTSIGWFSIAQYPKCTAVVRAKPAAITQAAQPFSARIDNTNTRFYIYYDASGNTRFYVGSGYAGGGSVSAGNTYTLAVERNNSSASGYINGVNVAGPTAVTFNDPVTGYFGLSLGSYAGNASNDEFTGTIEYAAIFKDTLTAAEHQLLHQNPYAFLKPVVPDYYALGAANDSGGVATGNIGATTDSISASLSGTTIHTANIAATTADAIAAIAGAVAAPAIGNISATTEDAVTAIVGAVTGPITGTLTATLDNLLSSIAGAVTGPSTGDIAANVDAVTAALSGAIAGPASGSISATTQVVAAEITGYIAHTGNITALVDTVSVSLSGVVAGPVSGSLASTLADVAGDFYGDIAVVSLGNINAFMDDASAHITAGNSALVMTPSSRNRVRQYPMRHVQTYPERQTSSYKKR